MDLFSPFRIGPLDLPNRVEPLRNVRTNLLTPLLNPMHDVNRNSEHERQRSEKLIRQTVIE